MADLDQKCFLVSCVGQKATAARPAKDLYVSDWFLKARYYVEQFNSPWFILSAEFGLVHPDKVIAPYERTLNHMRVAERRAWADRVISQMKVALPRTEEIILLAGMRYREFLMDYLQSRAKRVVTPLEGLRIGEQLSWLAQYAAHGKAA